MDKFRKLSLVLSAFVLGAFLFVSSATAQPGRARYEGNRGKHKGWTQGKHRGWDKNRNADYRWNRNRRVSDGERDRWETLRDRLRNRRTRYNSDGIISTRERRRLSRQRTNYRRVVRRDRRDWN